MKFSERIGAVRRVIQKDSMDDALKNALWNVGHSFFWATSYRSSDGLVTPGGRLLQAIWIDHFHKPAQKLSPAYSYAYKAVYELYAESGWASVYDFIEFVSQYPFVIGRNWRGTYVAACNAALEKHVSAYRFVGAKLALITSEEEIAAVEQGLSHVGKFAPVAAHLETALTRFSDRSAPDYRNSIKESISAVEAACQIITGDDNATLDKALKQIGIHPALQKGFGAIYGYTSDADGIRHALPGETNVTADDAKFFLVSCSAFVNYLIAKGSTGVTGN